MAKKIDLSLVHKIEEGLNSQEEWQSEINFHELVGLTFSAIDTAVKRKASWTAIAESIQELIGSEEQINSNTLRQYYFYFKNHPEDLPKKKRKTGASKKKQKGATSESSQSIMTIRTPDRSDSCSTSIVQASAETVDNQADESGEEITETETLLPEPKKRSGSNFAY